MWKLFEKAFLRSGSLQHDAGFWELLLALSQLIPTCKGALSCMLTCGGCSVAGKEERRSSAVFLNTESRTHLRGDVDGEIRGHKLSCHKLNVL